jgi:3-deoxy-manno-octulosonate cytidylyltransferase (CMP-KDO synthetase)
MNANAYQDVVAVIPARYGSLRFPGKPLAEIAGKPMILWVAERVRRASLVSRVIVATDDERIRDCVRDSGWEAVMTPESIPSGTDRVAHAVSQLKADVVVNVQGDEPFIEPREIDRVVLLLREDKTAVMGTLVKRIARPADLVSPDTVKVVVDEARRALYFSRSPIPFYRDRQDVSDWLSDTVYYKHVGVYSFRKDFLLRFAGWQPTALEKTENLEQLRALEKGYTIKVAETESEPMGVDTPEDLERVRRLTDERASTI